MNTRVLIFMVLLAAISATASASSPKVVDANVMTYNIHHGADATTDDIAQTILAEKPDFVLLQEVDACTARSTAPHQNGLNILAQLGAATNMFSIYGPTLPLQGGYYGIAMLSRYPYLSTNAVELPNPENFEPRILLEGVFDLDGQKVVVAVTHLSVEADSTRTLQAQYIMERFSTIPYPIIFGGDLNSTPSETPIAIFETGLSNLSGEELTWPAIDSESKLDYIFGNKQVEANGEPRVVRRSTPCSDHAPVVVPVRINFAE